MSQRASVRLADVAAQGQYGLNAAAMKEGRGVRFIRITDIDDQGELRSDGTAYVPASTENLDAYRLEAGDLLIARSGATAGKSLLFKGLDEDAVFAGYLIRFKLDITKVLPDYAGYFFKSNAYWNYINTTKRAAAQPNINAKELASLPMPLPPLPEQRRIVDLLSRAEGIVRLRRRAQQKADALIPAIFVDMFGDPATNPKGWPTKLLRDLVELQSGGTPPKARDDYWQGEVPWVSPKDMKRMAMYDATDHISSLVLAETSLKLVAAGAVLIVIRGMILAHTVPVAQARVPLTVNQDMKALLPKGEISSTYLLWMLKVCHDRLLAKVSTAAHGTKKLDTARLEEMVIPVPPIGMQQTFEANVRYIEAIQQHQVNGMTKAEATFSALLAREFMVEGSVAVAPSAEGVVA